MRKMKRSVALQLWMRIQNQMMDQTPSHIKAGKVLRFFSGLIFVFFTFGCQVGIQRYYDNGISQAQKKDFPEAISSLEKVWEFDPSSELGLKALKEVLRIATFEIKDYA